MAEGGVAAEDGGRRSEDRTHWSNQRTPRGEDRRWKIGVCPVTEDVADRIVRLPFYTSMTEDEQGRVVEEVKKLKI
jgi:dTDP-4-amino-4,6-dideoxygalactose transaminase